MTTTNTTTAIDLSSFFQTKAQANDFAARLATVTEEIYKVSFNLETVLMEQFGITKKDKLIALMRDNTIPANDVKAIKEFFQKLQAEIPKLTVLPITIAFEPKEQTLKLLTDWFLINLKKQVLFDITVDRKLIAGAAITYNGKFKDFSIKAKVEATTQTILTQPQQVHALPGKPTSTDTVHVGR